MNSIVIQSDDEISHLCLSSTILLPKKRQKGNHFIFKKLIATTLTATMILSSGIFAMAQEFEAEEEQPTFEATVWTPPAQQCPFIPPLPPNPPHPPGAGGPPTIPDPVDPPSGL